MVRGIGKIKSKKRKSLMERDIERTRDIATAYLQGGKAVGEITKKRINKEKRKK